MTALAEEVDTEPIVLLDFDIVVTCDADRHDEGDFGCIPAESARWRVVTPCCGDVMLMCDGWVVELRSDPASPLLCVCGRRPLAGDVDVSLLG